ncbi:MAG: hypothetical protein H7A23_26665, partial [Leptospiraceae bacterium]|nr:hypothetical protein [Leptospiraceae bacterium]
MIKYFKTAVKYIGLPFPYLIPLAITLFAMYSIAPNWRTFVYAFLSYKFVYILVLISSLSYIYSEFGLLKKFFKSTAFRLSIIFVLLMYSLISGIHLGDFFVLFYALFLILFSARRFLPFYTILKRLAFVLSIPDGRIPAVFALLFLVFTPVFLIFRQEKIAEQSAIYAYYFLVITVITQIIEMKASLKKDVFPIFMQRQKEFWLNLISGFFRGIKWNHIFKVSLVVFLIAAIYVSKSLYTRKTLRLMEANKAYQSKITLLADAKNEYTLSSRQSEFSIPILVEHPISKPFIWDNVTIRILWFKDGDGSNTRNHRESVLEEIVKFEGKSMVVGESKKVKLKLKRNFLPEGKYGVWIGLAYKDPKNKEEFWFSEYGASFVKLSVHVSVNASEISTILNQNILQEWKRLEEEWSNELNASPGSYRSSIHFAGNLYKDQNFTFQISNKGNITWPTQNKTPVMLGMMFVKNEDNGKMSIQKTACLTLPTYIQSGETIEFYKNINNFIECPLPGRGKDEYKCSKTCIRKECIKDECTRDKTIQKERKIFKKECIQKFKSISSKKFYKILVSNYDEIWIGMLHAEKLWFYQIGDNVLKIKRTSDKEMSELLLTNNEAIVQNRIHLVQNRLNKLNAITEEFKSDNLNYRSE